MARIRVTLDGSTAVNGSPLLMHNERLADPIDPYTRWLAELTKKRTKTERDHEEIGRREFMGGGYWANDDGPDKNGGAVHPDMEHHPVPTGGSLAAQARQARRSRHRPRQRGNAACL
jgi:hypothetical protein